MKPAIRSNADGRPRIHIWGDQPAEFAFHPGGARRTARSVGSAVEQALAEKGAGPAVIIYEGKTG